MQDLLEQIKEKYQALGQPPETYLHGLLLSKPVTYWEYVQVDTLLSLQNTRTEFKDETIFIVYHQITELVLKLIRHELEQLTTGDLPDAAVFSEKMHRLVRYTRLLSTSFSIMNQGMRYEDYNQFRLALAPASGFQSAQFRFIELHCTPMDHLIPPTRRASVPADCPVEEKFQYLYWQDAGYDRATGTKSLTLRQFEERYLDSFSALARKMQANNLYARYLALEEQGRTTDDLRSVLRTFDYTFNVSWPLVHLQTAHTYLGGGEHQTAATGGSHWEKYLHPKYQQRIFFPTLWSDEERAAWGDVHT
ncbi:MAG: tryptophan 2,3-dioxygenase family protein [Saprospiraceae bacterium]